MRPDDGAGRGLHSPTLPPSSGMPIEWREVDPGARTKWMREEVPATNDLLLINGRHCSVAGGCRP